MNLEKTCLKIRMVLGALMFSLPIHAKAAVPVQSQLAETAFLLRSSQNSQILKSHKTVQLMNLCKIIGQSQVLLLQIPVARMAKAQKKYFEQSIQESITDLQQACDGSNMQSTDELLKRAWQLTGKVQKRLTQLSRSTLQREDT